MNFADLRESPPQVHAPYCPLCWCNKSGDREVPNGITEACEFEFCPCHTEDSE